MILEYVAHSAVADIRRFAAPAALGGAVLSRGVEEHAGLRHPVGPRHQRRRGRLPGRAGLRADRRDPGAAPAGRRPPRAAALRRAFDLADSALDRTTADRPLDSDLTAAEAVLTGMAAVAPWP